MPNDLYNSLNQNQNSGQNVTNRFIEFVNGMRGKNPNQILNDLVSSGRVSQAQLNQVQRQAQQMEHVFTAAKKCSKCKSLSSPLELGEKGREWSSAQRLAIFLYSTVATV